MSTTGEPVVVSRRIKAPAGDVFRILADPGRHPDLGGSGTVRGGVFDAVVAGVGDVFVMRMRARTASTVGRFGELCAAR